MNVLRAQEVRKNAPDAKERRPKRSPPKRRDKPWMTNAAVFHLGAVLIDVHMQTLAAPDESSKFAASRLSAERSSGTTLPWTVAHDS